MTLLLALQRSYTGGDRGGHVGEVGGVDHVRDG